MSSRSSTPQSAKSRPGSRTKGLRQKTRESFRKWRRASMSNKENRILKKPQSFELAAYQAYRELKTRSSQTISNLKSAVGNISSKYFKGKPSVITGLTYSQLDNTTPIKLYSPFQIDTPDRPCPRHTNLSRRRCVFSPTGTLKKDMEDMISGIEDLNTVAERVKQNARKSP